MLTTPGGWLLLLAVLAPFVGVLVGLALGGRNAQRVAMLIMPVGLAVAAGIAWSLLQSGDTVVYLLGGWAPPLGIALRADGLSAVMLLAVAVVVCGIGVYARADFGSAAGEPEKRAPFVYWLLLLAVWGSLNLVFVSGDLFTLYVALELLTFSGVPLVCLDGKRRDAARSVALPAVRARRLVAVPAGRRAAVRRLRDTRYLAAVRAHPARTHRVGRRRR